jgi:hypothetical protein
MILERIARETLTAVELDHGDVLLFTLASGQTRRIEVKRTAAWVYHSTLKEPKKEQSGAVTNYRFNCTLLIDGHSVTLNREVATQQSFYQPWELFGMRIWFDAVDDIFNFLVETHGVCRPRKKLRLAVQDATKRICPVLLHPWCPLPEGDSLRIQDCYNGEDCWMGAYFGASAHGGLDINHPAGTPIWAPLEFHDHFLFNTLGKENNNRWRGLHRWPDGSTWILQVHHVIRILFKEHEPIPAGAHFAEGAGVLNGDHEHSHFVFKIREPGAAEADDILLDPWILFWQMYQDRRLTVAKR